MAPSGSSAVALLGARRCAVPAGRVRFTWAAGCGGAERLEVCRFPVFCVFLAMIVPLRLDCLQISRCFLFTNPLHANIHCFVRISETPRFPPPRCPAHCGGDRARIHQDRKEQQVIGAVDADEYVCAAALVWRAAELGRAVCD